MDYFWSNIFEYFKDRRLAGVFFAHWLHCRDYYCFSQSFTRRRADRVAAILADGPARSRIAVAGVYLAHRPAGADATIEAGSVLAFVA